VQAVRETGADIISFASLVPIRVDIRMRWNKHLSTKTS
jgi:hypothetical protein